MRDIWFLTVYVKTDRFPHFMVDKWFFCVVRTQLGKTAVFSCVLHLKQWKRLKFIMNLNWGLFPHVGIIKGFRVFSQPAVWNELETETAWNRGEIGAIVLFRSCWALRMSLSFTHNNRSPDTWSWCVTPSSLPFCSSHPSEPTGQSLQVWTATLGPGRSPVHLGHRAASLRWGPTGDRGTTWFGKRDDERHL